MHCTAIPFVGTQPPAPIVPFPVGIVPWVYLIRPHLAMAAPVLTLSSHPRFPSHQRLDSQRQTWRHYCPIGAQIQSDSKVAVACLSVPNNEAAHAQPLIEHWLTHWSSTDNFIDQPTYRHNYVIFTSKNWEMSTLFEKFDYNQHSNEILYKIAILVSFNQNREFPTILTKIKIFRDFYNFDQNRDFSRFRPKSKSFW